MVAALEAVRAVRPIASPNAGFMTALKHLEDQQATLQDFGDDQKVAGDSHIESIHSSSNNIDSSQVA